MNSFVKSVPFSDPVFDRLFPAAANIRVSHTIFSFFFASWNLLFVQIAPSIILVSGLSLTKEVLYFADKASCILK